MKKASSTVILFPYGWFPQTPTVMGLYKELKRQGNVTILTLYNENRGSILDNPDFIYLNRYRSRFHERWVMLVSYLLYQLLKVFRFLLPGKAAKYRMMTVEWIWIFLRMNKYLKRAVYTDIIAVDTAPAFFCQLKRKNYHFLSTELQKELLEDMKVLQTRYIRSVIIQTSRRFDLLTIPCKEKISNIFFIQNAPNFAALPRRTAASNKLIFAGALWEGFGFVYCLEFARKYKEFTLTIKGTPQSDIEFYRKKYAPEIAERRVTFDTNYSDTNTFNELLLGHSIGFSFYDENHPVINASIEHYATAPSGKMFTYFGLGIPVIGSKGLSEIDEFEAGVTIADYSPESIYKAVQKILIDYKRYSDNALKVASHYSFEKMAKSFVDYLKPADTA